MPPSTIITAITNPISAFINLVYQKKYNVPMLIDHVELTLQAGHGGRGRVSFGQKGPDGGSGGKGGDIVIKVTSDMSALNQFAMIDKIVADDGLPGTNCRSSGRKGEDKILILPIGTSIETDSGEIFELTDLSQIILICKGGLGGKGNLEFKSSKNRSPQYAQPGLAGETKQVTLILRFIADYGLIGLPNAGKSSLLNKLTNAKAQVGAYPFTTLETNLGAMGTKIIADIPGLIEGASAGRGLGHQFLQHIEKVQLLLHCISVESDDVVADYQTINSELAKYNPALLAKKRLILLTKTDLVDQKETEIKIQQLSAFNYPVYPISIYSPINLKF